MPCWCTRALTSAAVPTQVWSAQDKAVGLEEALRGCEEALRRCTAALRGREAELRTLKEADVGSQALAAQLGERPRLVSFPQRPCSRGELEEKSHPRVPTNARFSLRRGFAAGARGCGLKLTPFTSRAEAACLELDECRADVRLHAERESESRQMLAGERKRGEQMHAALENERARADAIARSVFRGPVISCNLAIFSTHTVLRSCDLVILSSCDLAIS